MACYRRGGCGPYESLSCSECPASQESYLTRKATPTTAPSDLKNRVLHKTREAKRLGIENVDAVDVVLADLLREASNHAKNVGATVISLHSESKDRAAFERLFATLTGSTWTQYLKRAETALDEAILGMAFPAPEATQKPARPAPPATLSAVLAKLVDKGPVEGLDPKDLESWPHWGYGYYGTDGCDWLAYVTHDGILSIPSHAEEIWPIEGGDVT